MRETHPLPTFDLSWRGQRLRNLPKVTLAVGVRSWSLVKQSHTRAAVVSG